jgi:Flp pilus assembly protein TadD
MSNPAEALNAAIALQNSGRLEEAVAAYRSLLAATPIPEAWVNLGALLRRLGRETEAEAAFRSALALRENDAIALYNLANLYRDHGRKEEAEAAYANAVAAHPAFPQAWNNLGLLALAASRLCEAEQAFSRAVEFAPDYPEAVFGLANVLREQGKLEESLLYYRRARELRPDDGEMAYQMGNALFALRRNDEAASLYIEALRLNPNDVEALANLSALRQSEGDFATAQALLEKACGLAPSNPLLLANRGCLDMDRGRLAEAEALFHQAIALKPDLAEAHNNLGNVLRLLGRIPEARAAYAEARRLAPNDPDIQANEAFLLLLLGDYENGFKIYENRWRTRRWREESRSFSVPQWLGGEVGGKTILLHSEQGFGDSLQAVRYIPLLAERGARVILECQAALKKLLQGTPGVHRVLARGETLPHFDLHCPTLSLPLAFGTRVDTIPTPIPYIRPAPALVEAWGRRLPKDGRKRVGLVWSGDSRRYDKDSNLVDQRRSARLSDLAPLLAREDFLFVSLQKGEGARQAEAQGGKLPLFDITAELQDFADTAGLAANLDLVISVDTSVAHLAGGMGLPVFLMSRFDGCWRWLLERSDSPWYPTLRIFRQPAPGDWQSVVEEMLRTPPFSR